jgi:hypothetical protein
VARRSAIDGRMIGGDLTQRVTAFGATSCRLIEALVDQLSTASIEEPALGSV